MHNNYYEQMDSIVKSPEKIREKSDSEFKKLFEDTTKLGQKLHGEHFEIKKPRTTHRSNPDVGSAVRITLFNEFVPCGCKVASTFHQ